jgi:hypothetical protein
MLKKSLEVMLSENCSVRLCKCFVFLQDEWTAGVATTLSAHLSFYASTPDDACSTLEKLFLVKFDIKGTVPF